MTASIEPRRAVVPFADQLADALREVRANALASLLSALAVTIATLGVLLVASITQGLGRSFERLAFSGGPVLTIAPDPRPSLSALRPTRRDYVALRSALPDARRVSLVQSLGTQTLASARATAAIPTVTADYSLFQTGRYDVLAGRPLVPSDGPEQRRVIVLDRAAAERLGLDVADVGSRIRLGGQFVHLVGLVKAKGLGADSSGGDGLAIVPDAVVPEASASPSAAALPLVIEVEVPPGADLDTWQARIGILLRRERNLAGAQQAGFAISSSERVRAGIRSTTALISLTATLLMSISLVVGAVGIVNVSLISVRHRYFEIGLRIAVGATHRLIMRQFLLENVIVAVAGALVAIGVFALLAAGANDLLGGVLVLDASPLVIGLAVLAAVAVGVVSGVAPALRAANLDPATALRT
ncbi:ABC transporter permease [Dokdonella sp.]|uniref:ABC transporter permease n=1 Tax=Dokdonella sp. TaxID=2291710 RepID=UPI001B23D8A3|nr:ABC transporter permease [Dokdonella sp.]MBO9664757.1 ABC transporter permease [Dokdonella sp.]